MCSRAPTHYWLHGIREEFLLCVVYCGLHTLLSEASATGGCRRRMMGLIDYLEGPDLGTHVLFCEFCNDSCFMWFGKPSAGALLSVMPAPVKLLS